MKRFMMSLAIGVAVLTCGTARATIIDDFSADSSDKYNVLWTSGVTPASYGRNASDQFAPQANGGATTMFVRNDGYTFNVGDTISVEVYGISQTYQTAGLVITPSLQSLAGEREYYVQNWGSGDYTLDSNANLPNYNHVSGLDLSQGPVTLTVTRTSPTSADYTYVYHKTTGGTATLAYTDSGLTAGTYYFGLGGYDSAAAGQVMDNLSYSAVPEPSLSVLMVSGMFGLLAYAWRKRRIG